MPYNIEKITRKQYNNRDSMLHCNLLDTQTTQQKAENQT